MSHNSLAKLTLVTALLTLSLVVIPQLQITSVSAETETKNDSPASDSADEKAQMLENLERLTREKDANEQTRDLYNDVGAKKRGFVAQVVSIKDKTVKVANLDQTEQFLTFDKSTSLISSGKETTADMVDIADWIDIEDWLVVIGVEEDDAFAPRRILISSVDLAPKSKIVKIGTVDTITKTKLTLKTVGNGEEEDAETLELVINNKTVLENDQKETLKITEFKSGDQVMVSGIEGAASNTAKTIRLIGPNPADEQN